jgi:hypothetical protein
MPRCYTILPSISQPKLSRPAENLVIFSHFHFFFFIFGFPPTSRETRWIVLASVVEKKVPGIKRDISHMHKEPLIPV